MSDQPDKPDEIDVAIVGAGIAGLYCAYAIMNSSEAFARALGVTKQNLKVRAFEAAGKIGGRIRTERFPHDRHANWEDCGKFEFFVDFGPMRIEPEHQRLLGKLLDELEIRELAGDLGAHTDDSAPHLQNFPPYTSPVSMLDPKYDLTGDEQLQKTPLDLMKLAFTRMLGRFRVSKGDTPGGRQLQRRVDEVLRDLERAAATRQPEGYWQHILQKWIDDLGEADYQNIREFAEFEDVPLYEMGFWNLVSAVLTHDAVNKLRDLGTFYHLLAENPNAAEWLIFWLRGLKTTKKLQGSMGE